MGERILFYRLGALGDTLLTLPALDALRLRYPGAHIALAARCLASNFPGKWLVSSPFPPEKEKLHTANWLRHSLKPLGVSPEAPATAPLQPSPGSREKARRLLRGMGLGEPPFQGIHPGGGRVKWPPPGTLTRIARDYCRKSPTQPFLIRGPADGEACEVFLGHWGDALPILETPRLEVLAGALADMGAYLGGDT